MSVSNNIYIKSQKLFIIQSKNRDDCDKAKEVEMSRTRSTHVISEKRREDISYKIFKSHRTWGDLAIDRKVILTLRLLMSYIYGAPILDVSRSYTTTHHSR